MRKLLYISTFLAFAAALSSCSKNEVEGPEAMPQNTVKTEPIDVQNTASATDKLDEEGVYIDQTPMTINDDGDDEDEDINTVKDNN